ncbi:hypothetical protein CYMTET_43191 [Cymbomonas tetramitiformis]|uniref:Cytochrome P450 n=1 Tax=Cymbomonas tetramitiformis TaxID=36881 RepID=A0AAE0C3R5_9CHLO|nr:hypothetical protein CYMTET_43191 [Cymbomonas tetramitiformis]
MNVPGENQSMGLLSDESITFGQDPVTFVDKKIKKFGQIFGAKVMNENTVFVASQKGMQDLLLAEGAEYTFGTGYKTLMQGLYSDDTLLLADGGDWKNMRQELNQVFTRDLLSSSLERIQQHVERCVAGLGTEPVELYPFFRSLAEDISLMLFVDLQPEEMGTPAAENIRKQQTEHWHGLITVKSSLSSSYRKALKAREAIEEEIRKRLSAGREPGEPDATRPSMEAVTGRSIPMRVVEQVGDEAAVNQLTLLVSALVPKVITAAVWGRRPATFSTANSESVGSCVRGVCSILPESDAFTCPSSAVMSVWLLGRYERVAPRPL